MKKKLILLALTCLIFSIVSGNANKTEENSTDNVGNNYECEPETTTTIKLPLFVRIFGKKPLRFIKKSISRILGKNLTAKISLQRNHSTSKDAKIRRNEHVSPSSTVPSTRNVKDVNIDHDTERQTHKSDSSSTKSTYLNPVEYYRKFVYTSKKYSSSSVKIRKYYTPVGFSAIQRTTNQQTIDKISRGNQRVTLKNSEVSSSSSPKLRSNAHIEIDIFTTRIPVNGSGYENAFNEKPTSQSDQNLYGGKRQRRCSIQSSDLEEGYTYLLRKKRSESTFNPLAYLTRLSKKPVFTGDYSPRKYTYPFRYYSSARNQNIRTNLTAFTTSTLRTRPIVDTKSEITSTTTTKTFERVMPKSTATTSTSPKPTFKTIIKYWSPKHYTTSTPKITTNASATNDETCAGNSTTRPTPRKHFWINNWNQHYMSYYMGPINHTFRTYEPPVTTYDPSSHSKTTRAMYYLTQYWNKEYFSYYTNFDPSDESLHAFAKRLGYFPDATTLFPKIRMMPKRYRPEGFIDIFSLDSYLRDINERLENNQSFPPPHERDSISASSEDVSYWFFFNHSVTPVQLIPGTPWKKKPRPTMKPVPSYFFKDSILTRYYPPSNEEDLEKIQADFKNFKRIYLTTKPATRSFSFYTTKTPLPAVRTSATPYSMKFLHIKTTIPTLPTNKESTAHNIDPYGLLNKIIQYNVKIKKPLSRNGTKDVQAHLAKLHPVNQLPRILQLPYTLSPKLMMYSDYRGKQLFTLLGKYHVYENNKTLECVQNPSEFLNPFKVVAPPPESGYYRILERHRIRNNMIERKPIPRGSETKDEEQQSLQTDGTVAVEIRFYPIHSTAKIKTWKEYLALQKNRSSISNLPAPSTPLQIGNKPAY